MDIWDEDPLSNFVNRFFIELGPSEELPQKVNSFKIVRNEELNIILHTLSHAGDRPKEREVQLGHVYTLDNSIELKGYAGSGHLTRVSGFNVISKMHGNNLDTATESKYKVDQVHYRVSDSAIEYTVDRIANLPDNYHWPDSSSDKISGSHERTFTGNPSIEINTDLPRDHIMSRTCARFKLGDHTAIISTMKSENISKSKGLGYIYYSGNPDKETREKIRSSLSFTFGLPLVYLSSCFYGQKGALIGFEAVSPSTIGGRAWDIVSQPLAPITLNQSIMLDRALLQATAQAFFDNYDVMNLRGFLFRLWYAEVSPAHMKAAHYGAIIESIQKREIEKSASEISRTIISKTDYRKTISILTKFLQKLPISPAAKELFLHKIQQGNVAPQRIISERFYGALGLTLGTLELTAWSKRNDAAHGNEILPGTEIDNIRSTKILRVILGRIILKTLNASPQYIDYYSLGHPIRDLSEAIPVDTE